MFSLSRITNNTESAENLATIFNPESIIACSYYGDGGHCDRSVAGKVKIWGGRDVQDSSCARPNFILDEKGIAVGISIIGFTGSTPTVIDNRAETKGSVYEMSGLFIRDTFLNDLDAIAIESKKFMEECKADEGYTKAIATFSLSHPYQEDVLLAAGATKITAKNLEFELGNAPFHPERFQFSEADQLQECSKWSSEEGKIEHDAWHASEPCIAWADKTMLAFDVLGEAIFLGAEL